MTSAKPVVFCDIELYRNYFLVGFRRASDGAIVKLEMTPDKPLDRARLKRIMLTHRIVTFNGLAYDVPLIFYAIAGASNAKLKEMSDRIIQGGVRYWDVENMLGIKVPAECDHIDLIEPQPNAFASLKTLQGRLHGRKMQDLPIEPHQTLSAQDMADTSTYNENDLDATENLFDALEGALALREALGKQFGANFMSKSDAQIGEAIIKKEVEKVTRTKAQRVETPAGTAFNYQIPTWLKFESPELKEVLTRLETTQFVVKSDGKVDLPPFLRNRVVRIGNTDYAMGIGGLHSTEKERAVVSTDEQSLWDFDVVSYYPIIAIRSGLYPRSLGRTFIEVFDRIRLQRVAAKNRQKELGDLKKVRPLSIQEAAELATAKTTAEGLKIALNGCYGKLGSRYSILYAPHLMIAITVTGQLALLMLIDRAEAAGIPVVSANTDGVVFNCPTDLEGRMLEITRQWEADTGFELESTRYAGLYSQSVNSYIAMKPDGTVKRKGKLQNPHKETPPDIRTLLMTSPSMNILSDAVVAYLKDGTPLEQTIRERDDIRDFVTVVNVKGGGTWRGGYLGKVVRFIWSRDGDPILYKTPHPTTGNYKKVPLSEGCRPVMELPDEFPIDVDFDRYIAAAKEMMMAIGADQRPPQPKKFRVYAKDRLHWLAVSLAA